MDPYMHNELYSQLTRIADALEVLATDTEEQRHARRVWDREEYERLQKHLRHAVERHRDNNDMTLESFYSDQVADVGRAIDLHLEMYPHLKED